jgi:hypothetical protein
LKPAPFNLHFEKRHSYLLVEGSGVRDNLKAIFDSMLSFSQIVREAKSDYVLVDYSRVTTHVSISDVFNITRLYETQGTVLSRLCLSIVINPSEIQFEKIWEEICQKRGFNFKIFLGVEEAETWLLQQISQRA